jgi:hypothetical protein
VRLIWRGNDQIMETGSDLGYRNNDRSFTNTRLNRPLTRTSPCEDWSLTSLKEKLMEKLIKIGAKIVSHGRYVAFQMAEVAIPRKVFADILRLIAELRPPVTSTARCSSYHDAFAANHRRTDAQRAVRPPNAVPQTVAVRRACKKPDWNGNHLGNASSREF